MILRSLCEKEAQGFNELFRDVSKLRLESLPDLGHLSKGTYFDYMKNLMDIGAVTRMVDPGHSQRLLYRVEPLLGEELKGLYGDVESSGYYPDLEAAERFFGGLEPEEAALRLAEYAVGNLIRAYLYCIENPSLAEYRLSLTMRNLEMLGALCAKLGAQPDVRSVYLDAMNELNRKWVRIREGGA